MINKPFEEQKMASRARLAIVLSDFCFERTFDAGFFFVDEFLSFELTNVIGGVLAGE